MMHRHNRSYNRRRNQRHGDCDHYNDNTNNTNNAIDENNANNSNDENNEKNENNENNENWENYGNWENHENTELLKAEISAEPVKKSPQPQASPKQRANVNMTGRNPSAEGNMTDSAGRPVFNDNDSLAVVPDGPVLIGDIQFIDKLAHFDRERIPERVVHAKGTGAFGEFVSYGTASKYTIANFLKAGKRTRVFVRFSTVIGSKGSADTVRDPRGFAVKFYTDEGIYDIVGNDLPVFFIRDAIKFPDVIHSLKPSPNSNLRDPERFWDFISLTPEATHMITWLYSDRGTIKSYRHVDGFGVNTYVWVSDAGKRYFIKYHWKTMQGLQTIDRFEAEQLAGSDPDVAVRDLYDAIASGKSVRYELCVQIMDPEDANTLPFDPLDDTKVWDEKQYPLIKIGMMTLNKNPDNFFAQVEQSAFCPGNLVPGVDLSADKMLQGRSFSYLDTQRYRLGANFMDLPVNRSVSKVNNNQRDGAMTYYFNPNPINYSPNSLNNNNPKASGNYQVPYEVCGEAMRAPIAKTDDFTQAGEHYESLSETERQQLASNIASELAFVRNDIKERVLTYLGKASRQLAEQVIYYCSIIRQK